MLDRLAGRSGDFEREFVFVDDGGADDSPDILRARMADRPDTRIVAQANAGPARATNRGLALAGRPFVKLCDADDLLAGAATTAADNRCAGTSVRQSAASRPDGRAETGAPASRGPARETV